MDINFLSFLNFNKNFKPQIKKTIAKNQQKNVGTEFNINSYPKNYYLNQISFGFKSRLSATRLIDEIGEENFPNKEIVKKLKDVGFSRNYCLYDIHLEYYKDLLSCTTLDEAKQKYPEFKGVIDAKVIDYKSKDKRSTIYKIVNNDFPSVDTNNLSLGLLKKYYGQLLYTTKKENYYNIDNRNINNLLNLLKIKKMNSKYLQYVITSNPQKKEENSKKSKELWDKDDGTMKQQVKNLTQNSDVREKISNANKMLSTKYRKAVCDKLDKIRQQPDTKRKMSEAAKKRREKEGDNLNEKLIKSRQNPETKRKISNSNKKRWEKNHDAMLKLLLAGKETPKYQEKKKKYEEAKKLAWERHPEITSIMSEIAKSHKILQLVVNKIKLGKPLSEKEQAKRNAFFKECAIRMPGYQKIIGQEYHNILVEWGLKDK